MHSAAPSGCRAATERGDQSEESMDVPFVLGTMAKRGLLRPGRPDQVGRQLNALRRYGFGLGGELRSTAARHPDRVAVIDETGERTYAQLLRRTERLAAA